MLRRLRIHGLVLAALVAAGASAPVAAQTLGEKESFTAIAIANNELGSGAGRVLIDVTRWSTDAETAALVKAVQEGGSQDLLEKLRDQRSTGTIRTPDSLAYDLRFAQEMPAGDGGRRIILATDRPMSFWETWNQSRTIDYPFTVIQMEIGRDGHGKGTMSYAAKVIGDGKFIELENFGTSPVMLTEIEANTKRPD
jgi:hypothetical protein